MRTCDTCGCYAEYEEHDGRRTPVCPNEDCPNGVVNYTEPDRLHGKLPPDIRHV